MFSLVSQIFDPNETFTDLINIFKPQTDARGLYISWSIDPNLKAH